MANDRVTHDPPSPRMSWENCRAFLANSSHHANVLRGAGALGKP